MAKSENKANFVRIGSIDRYTGEFSPKKIWKSQLPLLSFNLPNMLDLIEGKLRFNIINENERIFLNKSKSGKALYFKFQERYFNIPIKAITEFNGRWIGVFTIEE